MRKLLANASATFKEASQIPAYVPALASTFLMGIGFALTMTFMPLFGLQQIGMSPFQLGVFLTVTSIFEVIAASWIGKLSDTAMDRRKVLLAASAAAIAGYALFAFIDNYWGLLGISISLIALATSVFPQLFAYVQQSADNERVNASMGLTLQRTIFSLSWVAGPLLAPLFIHERNYDRLFLFVAGLYIVIIVMIGLFLPSQRPRAVTVEAVEKAARGSSSRSGRFLLWLSVAAFVTFETSNAMSGIALPMLSTLELDATDRTVGWLVGLNALLQIPLMLGFGLLAKRYGNAMLMRSAGWFGLLYFLLAAFAETAWQLAACQLLNAAFISVVLGVGLNYCQDLMPDSPGTAAALYSNATTIGVMVGGFVAGSVGEWVGNRAIFAACAILSGIGLVLINGAKWQASRRRRINIAADQQEQTVSNP